MQFSFENKENSENVFQGLLQECRSSQSYPNDYKTRLWHALLGGVISNSPRITNSPITTSLSESPLIGIGQDEELMNTEVVENGNRLSIQEIIEILLNNKEKNQNQKIQNQAEFLDALKSVGQNQIMENFKALGQMFYANKEVQKECNSDKEIEQLATPMQTPIESELPFGNKEKNNSLVVPNTPAATVGLNFALPTLDSTPINKLIPSPNAFSPVQTNLNALGLIGRNVSFELPQLLETPLEKPIMVNTPICAFQQEPMIITQDELNPFKSPAVPVEEQTSQLLAPSPIINNSLNALLNQTPIQSPAISQLNSPVPPMIQDPSIVAGLLGSFSNQSSGNSLIPETPYIGSADPSLLLNASAAVPNPSPFLFPIASTPALTSEQYNEELSTLLTGNNLLSANPVVAEDESEVLKNNEENSNLEIMKNLLDDLLKKDNLDDILKETLEKSENEKSENEIEVHDECECTTFPSKEMIKQCMVNELEFEFSNENITKLVHKAPVEVVQEDVIELEKLAKQKRGKGRPRKPRKYSICPFTGCGKKFNREFNLKEHIRIHNPRRNKEFVCQMCNEKFYSSSVLSRHINSIHEDEKFYCKNCGKKFNRKDALHRHEKISCHFSS